MTLVSLGSFPFIHFFLLGVLCFSTLVRQHCKNVEEFIRFVCEGEW